MASRMPSLCRSMEQFRWFRDPRLLCTKTGNTFSMDSSFVQDLVAEKRLLFVGEQHGQPRVVELELALLQTALRVKKGGGRIHLFMEHFSLEQQPLLERFARKEVDFAEMSREYHEGGDEGHDLEPYRELLEFAAGEGDVDLVGGFLPRRMAKVAVRQGEEVALTAAVEAGFLRRADHLAGSEHHYDFFESLISGRDPADRDVSQGFRGIFPAQVLKDSVMAAAIARRVGASKDPGDKFLVILGSGHCDYRFGVPERVDRTGAMPKERTCLFSARDEGRRKRDLKAFESVAHFPTSLPADVIFFYEDDDVDERLKSEVTAAYDAVAATARLPGDLRLASMVLKRLGYTDAQVATAGVDGCNFQGVGNPHKWADVGKEHVVVDLGSGLGVDAFIAAETAAKVIGVDLSAGEVAHATKRVEERGADNVTFVRGDVEAIPLPDATADRVISNGAFCLVPDKEAAFGEVLRVLKPGGRFSVACSTLLSPLDSGVAWPNCMRTFMPLAEVEPLLVKIGFVEITVDASDSKIILEGLESSDDDGSRKRIHAGSEEFSHLRQHDMNQLCARVVIAGVKPVEKRPDVPPHE